ncbi:hypothetical protein [Peterkaempfera griseoplana]|uniref:hypothetical protein n=1 Tax=Peterkaempfera griseoplana TaxID=66896 RepID=UPI0006E3E27E|nr:hypothetical protein [Peterkaempfera griseoplana]
MSVLFMPAAVKVDLGDHAPTDQGFPPKAIAHFTGDFEASAAHPHDLKPFGELKRYFSEEAKSIAPHILWDPFEGTFAQFFPADSRAKALKDSAGGTRTNRAGKVVVQIEALFFPFCRWHGQVFSRLVDTPCKGWPELHAWISSLGVPDTFPMGVPKDLTSHRSESVWETRGGWYGHSQVPENDHVDPGSWPAFP